MHRIITEQGQTVRSDAIDYSKQYRLGWRDGRPREQFSADSAPLSGAKRRDNTAGVRRGFDD